MITGGDDNKFLSNGLDLTWMMEHGQSSDEMIRTFWKDVLARLLTLNCHTVRGGWRVGWCVVGGVLSALGQNWILVEVCLVAVGLRLGAIVYVKVCVVPLISTV